VPGGPAHRRCHAEPVKVGGFHIHLGHYSEPRRPEVN